MTKVAAIETKGLCIGYLLKGGKRKVVHEDLNLQLVSGEVTCLLGLNGAGKSTLLRTLCGFQLPLGGEASFRLFAGKLFLDCRCCTDGKD